LGIGSSNKPLNRDNPFSALERKEMIISSTSDDDSISSNNIKIYLIPDVNDHQKWIKNIDSIVPKYDAIFSNDNMTGALYSKKGITVIPIPFSNRDTLSGTNIRNLIVGDQQWNHLVPDGTREVLERINAKNRLLNL
jgi:nicotinamide-nucleotide adenylyltransferase